MGNQNFNQAVARHRLSGAKILAGFLSMGVLASIFAGPPLFADSFDQSQATTYLKSQALDEWEVMALASVNGLSGVDLDFLRRDPGGKSTDLEKRILAIVAAGENPQNFGQVDFVQKLAATFSGTEIDPQSNLLNDDIFGLLAFTTSQSHSFIQTGLSSFLKQNQNLNGGWGFSKTAPSDSNLTAMAIMALLAAGESPNSAAVNRAFGYLDTTKTATGYQFDATSNFGPDSASTAWVISAFTAAGKSVSSSAFNYLQNLQLPNGSFAWKEGESGTALMTAYAVIALNRDFYPVKSQSSQNEPPTSPLPRFEVAILGPNGQIFQSIISFKEVSLTTAEGQNFSFNNPVAIGVITEAAKVSGFTYRIKNTSLGLFVESIAGIGPAGDKGWLYAVNGVKPDIGAADKILNDADRVIWFYGGPFDPVPASNQSEAEALGESSTSIQISLAANIIQDPTADLVANGEEDDELTVSMGDTITYVWTSANAASGSSILQIRNPSGSQVSSDPCGNPSGPFGINGTSGSISGVIASCQAGFTYMITYTATQTDGTTAQNTLTIHVRPSNPPPPAIIFGVDTSSINFGNLKPGATSSQRPIKIINSGSVNVSVSATLQNADQLYRDGLILDNTSWQNFRTTLDAKLTKTVETKLRVPSNYSGYGQKNDTLIFWATPK